MFAKSMVDFLESQGFGERDTNIFINNFPSRTNISNAICVYDTQSFSVKGRARNSVNFTCQIRVRNLKSDEAEKVAYSIYKELEKGEMYDSNNKRFTIKPLNPPMFLMFDSNNRANWVLNVTALALNY